MDFGENGEIANLVDFGEHAKLVDFGVHGDIPRLAGFGEIEWFGRYREERNGIERIRVRKGKEGKEKVINFRSLQAILIRISHSLCNIQNFVHTKTFTDFETGQTDRRSDGQTDRQTDRHDVTLEATPSKYFDGGLTKCSFKTREL